MLARRAMDLPYAMGSLNGSVNRVETSSAKLVLAVLRSGSA